MREVLDVGECVMVELVSVPPSPLQVRSALLAALERHCPAQATVEAAARAQGRYRVECRRDDGRWHLAVPTALLEAVVA